MIEQIPIGLIRVYQVALSPIMPALCGSPCGCRFSPSCSQYAIEALAQHGLVTGSALAAKRILRCNPLNPGGIDPVP
ncbi:MAG TPA: membrane protein insertion efficiency factor YidD [Opitutaceae bacterium]|jgi:hypothetical protein